MSERLSHNQTQNGGKWFSELLAEVGEKAIDFIFGNGIVHGPFSGHGTELEREIELMQALQREKTSDKS